MKISASIYAYGDSKSILDVVKSLDQLYIDSFHIDCNDDISVFDDIAKIRQISNTPIDLHIITSNPYKYFEKIEQFKIEYVQFQYESLEVKHIDLPHIEGTKWGLAIQRYDLFLNSPNISITFFKKNCNFFQSNQNNTKYQQIKK